MHAELSRLKRAVDYIEQARETVQEVQQINKVNQTKYEEVLESNESLKTEMKEQISATDGKFEQIVDELSKLTKQVNELQKKNEHQTNLKWYKKLFGWK